jgi:hypothetical protein
MALNNELRIANVKDATDLVRERLGEFAAAQGDDADAANAELVEDAKLALENLETAVTGLVP